MKSKVLAVLVGAAVLLAACSEASETPGDGGGDTGSGAAMGPGLSVGEALESELDGPLLVRGFVVADGDEVRLCQALLESFPPQCGGDSLAVEGLDLGSIAGLQSEGEVQWTSGEVQVLGDVEDGVLTVDANASA